MKLPLPYSRRFFRDHVVGLWRWYLPGTLAVGLTAWLGVQVPVTMAHGLDLLRSGEAGVLKDALLIAAIGVAVMVVRTLSRVWFFTPGREAECAVRERFFAHLLRLQPDFYARYPTGDLLSRATSDVTFARALAGFALLQGANAIGSLVMGTWQMLALSPLLTLGVAVPCALAYAVVAWATPQLMTLQRATQGQLGELSDELLGSFQGVATVQAFCVEEVFTARLDARAAELRRMSLRMTRLRILAFPLLTVAGGVATWSLLALGGGAVNSGQITAGELAAFVALVGFIIMPLRMFGWLLPVFQRAEASLERIYMVLDERPDRPDVGVAAPPPGTGPALSLRGLSFAYGDGPDRAVLQDIRCEIPAGATVGIYGRVGSGKSTLLKLLARLQNPPKGTLFVNGVDARDLDLDLWRRAVCMVPQTPFLFSESVEENIGFGASREAVTEAAAAASLRPDIEALQYGLDTVVGERGIALSGGQRQRVALARGLLRGACLVLLDDVLSAVDQHTERELLNTLAARSGATRLIVSHRLSALVHADLILVLDEGRLVDQGRHDELLQRPGPYADAWNAQAESVREAGA